jgi:hypothetical protein
MEPYNPSDDDLDKKADALSEIYESCKNFDEIQENPMLQTE